MKNMKHVLVALLFAPVCQAAVAPVAPVLSAVSRFVSPTTKPVVAGDVVDHINTEVAAIQAKVAAHKASKQHDRATALTVMPDVAELSNEEMAKDFLEIQQYASGISFDNESEVSTKKFSSNKDAKRAYFAAKNINPALEYGAPGFAYEQQNNKEEQSMPKTGYFSKVIKGMGALFVLKGVAVLSMAGVAYAKNQSNESVVVNPAESAIDPIQQNLEDDKIALLATGGANIGNVEVVNQNVTPAAVNAPISSTPSKTSAVISSIVAHPYATATAALATIAAAAYSLWYGQSQAAEFADEQTQDDEFADDVELALRKQKNQ